MTQTTVPVIFDLDGTLVDPAGGITDGIAAALTELGLAGSGQVPDGCHDRAQAEPFPHGHRRRPCCTAGRRHPASTARTTSPPASPRAGCTPGSAACWRTLSTPGRPIAVATQKPEGHRPDRPGAPRHRRPLPYASAAPPLTRRRQRGDARRGKADIVAAALADLFDAPLAGHAACRDGGGPGTGRGRSRCQRAGLHRRRLGFRAGRRTGRGGCRGDRAQQPRPCTRPLPGGRGTQHAVDPR